MNATACQRSEGVSRYSIQVPRPSVLLHATPVKSTQRALAAAVVYSPLPGIQQAFTTAAVCEVAVPGAARHNLIPPGSIRMFASLATNACLEVAVPPSSSSSSSGGSSIVAAAVSDSSTRDAFLLQFALITTQLKHAASSAGSTSSFSGLFHHTLTTSQTVAGLGWLIEGTVGLNTQQADATSSVVLTKQRQQGC
jgi:hypothetical protein